MFSFVELLDGTPHGLGARFIDRHSQGEKWNISAARTNQLTLYECRHFTNGMMIGDWFMWDAANGNLGLHLSFPTPYDAEKHRRLPGTGNPVNSP